MQGKSRSSTVVVAALCLEWRRPVAEVLAFVKEKRNMVEPNINFMTQLNNMEANGDFNNILWVLSSNIWVNQQMFLNEMIYQGYHPLERTKEK